jgi:hypothetical protein
MFSCNKENPVEPPPPPPPQQLDTASRFLWSRIIPINVPISNLYVADSSNIYIESAAGQCLYYNGVNINYVDFQDPGYMNDKVYGTDKNNVFFSGYKYKQGNNWYPILKKLTNGIMKSYDLDTGITSTSDLLIIGPDKAWVTAWAINKIYYFDNGNITEFKLYNSDSAKYGRLYKDKFGNIFAFFFKAGTNGSDGTMYTYKYTGSEFQLLRTDCFWNFDHECFTNAIYRCGDDIIMWNGRPFAYGKIYYFNGNEWILNCNTVSTEGMPFRFGGWSKDSLVIMYGQYTITYTWNGKNWRKEHYYFYLSPNSGSYDAQIETNNGNIYIAYYNHDVNWETCLMVGKPNKSNLINLNLKR